MSQYDPTCDRQIFVGHCDLYFMVHWICSLSWRLFDVWTSYFQIMSQYVTSFALEINVGHYDLYFMVQWFCLISYIVFDKWMSYFWKMSQCNTTFDLKINLCHSDLYFMVQWFLFFFCSEKHFSFIGKAWFRRATLSCDSSYLSAARIQIGHKTAVFWSVKNWICLGKSQWKVREFCFCLRVATLIGKQCRPRSDASESGVWSGSSLFANRNIYSK